MDVFKINFFFYFSYWLRLLLILYGDIESNPGPGSDRRVQVLYSNIRGLHANLDELAVAGSDYDVLAGAESKFPDRRHLSQLRIPGFGCPQQRLRNSTHGTNNFYAYAFHRKPGHDSSLYDCLLDSMARMQSVDDKAVFVFDSDANAHQSEWLESVSPTDRHWRDALDFCNQSHSYYW